MLLLRTQFAVSACPVSTSYVRRLPKTLAQAARMRRMLSADPHHLVSPPLKLIRHVVDRDLVTALAQLLADWSDVRRNERIQRKQWEYSNLAGDTTQL